MLTACAGCLCDCKLQCSDVNHSLRRRGPPAIPFMCRSAHSQCEMSVLHLPYKVEARRGGRVFPLAGTRTENIWKITKTETQRWFNPVSGRFCGTGIDVITFGFRGVLLLFGSDKAPDQTVIVENTNKALRVIFKVTRISTNHASVAKAGLRRSDMICCASGVWPSVCSPSL